MTALFFFLKNDVTHFDVSVRVEVLEKAFKAGQAALAALEEARTRSVVVPVQPSFQIAHNQTQQFHNGDDKRSERYGTQVVAKQTLQTRQDRKHHL